jgi:NitT/TauT family transport system permease protein
MDPLMELEMNEASRAPVESPSLLLHPGRGRRAFFRVLLGRLPLALRIILPLLALAAFLLFWNYAPLWKGLHEYEVPTFSEDIGALFANWNIIGPQLKVSIADSLIGFFVGNLLAVLGAILFTQSKYAEWTFFPLAILAQTIPIVVFAPLSFTIFNAMNWGPDDPLPIIGVGTKPILAVTVLITFFPTLINMTVGLKSIDPNLFEFMRLVNSSPLRDRVDRLRNPDRGVAIPARIAIRCYCSLLSGLAETSERWKLLWRLRLPSSMPYLFSSFRITATLCFVGAFVGEWTLAVNTGIGGLVKEYIFLIQYPALWACVIAFSVSCMIFFGIVTISERFLVPWRQQQ